MGYNIISLSIDGDETVTNYHRYVFICMPLTARRRKVFTCPSGTEQRSIENNVRGELMYWASVILRGFFLCLWRLTDE